jgi:chromosome segregation ATPase
MSISREKYEKLNRQKLHLKKTLDYNIVENAEKSLKLFNQEQEIETLSSELSSAKDELKKLQIEVTRWKSLSERLPDDAELEDLRKENRKQGKLIESFEKQIYKLENSKEMLLFQIKTIEESRNDLKAQLNELRQENRYIKKHTE